MALPMEVHSLMRHVSESAAGAAMPPKLEAHSQLGAQFENLMNRSSAPPKVASDEGSETVSKLVLDQQSQIDSTLNDVDKVMHDMPNMGVNELTSSVIRVSAEFVSMHVNITTKMAVVNSSKSAFETLMKQG
ncbi:MAG: hypothetical protein ABW032_09320 [Burkholderiaceae bacterium]